MSIEELRNAVEEHRRTLRELEAELHRAEREERDRTWFPEGFYVAYYILSGLVLGVIASWATLALNVVGASLVGEDPLKLLRVYSTILGGAQTAESSDAVVVMFSTGIHTLTGAVCGAPIHAVYSRYFMGQALVPRLAMGVVLGVVMWLVNFYGVLSWFQPMILGTTESYIVENIPIWVAILTHVAFAEAVLLLQPLAVFNAKNYPSSLIASEGEG